VCLYIFSRVSLSWNSTNQHTKESRTHTHYYYYTRYTILQYSRCKRYTKKNMRQKKENSLFYPPHTYYYSIGISV
jgi:hypothetical protein